MKKLITFLAASLFLIHVSCSNDDNSESDSANCDLAAIVDNDRYLQTDTINYLVTNVVLEGNCLSVTIGSSGCDPENWEMNLIDSGNVNDSVPAERQLKVELVNNEACQAAFTKTLSFDLKLLQVAGQHMILLNIAGWDGEILYEY